MTSIDAKIKAQILVEALPYIQQYAGEIVVIADGRIAERGSHAQLLQQNGLYAALCRTQNLLG